MTHDRLLIETPGADAAYLCRLDSPLGPILLASGGDALTGLWFEGQKHFPGALAASGREAALPVFRATARWLEVYFSGREPDFLPALAPKGTAFQLAVWARLLSIPYGERRTYAQLAAALAEAGGLSRVSPRAVGGAVGRNPISLLIPCHRVVGADGSLTGYAGGLARKRYLLDLERAGVGS